MKTVPSGFVGKAASRRAGYFVTVIDRVRVTRMRRACTRAFAEDPADAAFGDVGGRATA
jgi:hypothetical protein